MKKSDIPALVLAVAVLVGGFILVKTGAPKANAQLSATYNAIPTKSGKAIFLEQSANLTESVDPTLVDLDSQIISCNPNIDSLLGANPTAGGSCVAGDTTLATTTGLYLGGQCCGAMKDLTEYNAELKNLQQYKDIPDVPMNPYKTPIPLAKKWIDYDHATTLTVSEQATIDQATRLSKEGPCCCKCWHYFVNEGVAKQMIRDYHYTAAQVAAYWDTSSIC
ncbi:MAG: hypothetical protein ACYC6X_00380 [Minisyncoccota bacterium]